MTAARALVPSGPWTVDDLDDFPEGNTTRYELIDGALIVSAEPSLQHQRVNLAIARVLQSTRAIDLALKRQVLQEAGVPSYWLVDPDDGVDTVLELQDAVYVEVARGANVTVQQPFPVT
ncbi:MAG: Uma2 family endonuclease, partial [Frankiales bacterium]|nr:Uma2 family endonuclease [Frankiales bacterium]